MFGSSWLEHSPALQAGKAECTLLHLWKAVFLPETAFGNLHCSRASHWSLHPNYQLQENSLQLLTLGDPSGCTLPALKMNPYCTTKKTLLREFKYSHTLWTISPQLNYWLTPQWNTARNVKVPVFLEDSPLIQIEDLTLGLFPIQMYKNIFFRYWEILRNQEILPLQTMKATSNP